MDSKLQGYGIEMSLMSINELEMVRSWRNDQNVNKFMIEQQHISKSEHVEWFNSIKDSTIQKHYVIYYKELAIGLINAKSSTGVPLVKSHTINPGLYLAPNTPYKNTVLAFSPSLLLIDHLFEKTACELLLAQVLPDNKSAIRYNQSLGYRLEYNKKGDVLKMSLKQSSYLSAKSKLLKVLRF